MKYKGPAPRIGRFWVPQAFQALLFSSFSSIAIAQEADSLSLPGYEEIASLCCIVDSVDARRGTVRVFDEQTGELHDLKIDSTILEQVRPGQRVALDLKPEQLAPGLPLSPAVRVIVGPRVIRDPKLDILPFDIIQRLWWSDPPRSGIFQAGEDPTKPAILLIHGLNQTAESWYMPSRMVWKLGDATLHYFYNFRKWPDDIDLGKQSSPNVGIYKVDRSELIEIDENNWFDFLTAKGYTVASWSQPPDATIARAFPSATEALDSLAAYTARRNPSQPPPIALIGHSRGGLLIRKLLKDHPIHNDRIRWAITLNTPHHGSNMARAPAEMAAEIVDLLDARIPVSIAGVSITGGLKEELKQLLVEVFRPLNKILLTLDSRELLPDGPAIRDLQRNERPNPTTRYYTIGGNNPTYVHFYAWIFDAMSAVPQFKCNGVDCRMYFKWKAVPLEVPFMSPLFDVIRDFAPELKEGRGDGLVTDESARLSWATHRTMNINHSESLWNTEIQAMVDSLLSQPLVTVRPIPIPE